jgi:membrane protein DedA with SNARE-associated domain
VVLFEFLTGYITDLICTFGYPGIIFLMTLESACLPVPSEIVMPFAGFGVQQGRLEFFATGMAGAIGCLIGSVLSYVVGYYGGRPLLEKYGRYVLITRHEIDLAHDWFARYGVATVFIARLLPIVRTFVSLPAGIARMDFKKFVIYSFVGSLPWCYALAYAGVLLGENWDTLEKYWIYFDILTVIGIIAFFAYVGYKVTRGHHGQKV